MPVLRAFTLIEIAISLAVIGFALVAIIGILPSGMSVQKDNRQETIIDQDATIFIDAIQNGAHGLDDLTNYVYSITNYYFGFGNTIDPAKRGFHTNGFTVNGSWLDGAATPTQFPINNGYRIVGLLSTPKYTDARAINKNVTFVSNYVVAYVRAMSGSATDKMPQTNPDMRDLALNYRMVSEIVPYTYFEPDWTNYTAYTNVVAPRTANDWIWRSNTWMIARNTETNLYDFRLVFRWPLIPGNRPEPKRQIFRTMLSGSLILTNDPYPIGSPTAAITNLYFFQPRTYVKAL